MLTMPATLEYCLFFDKGLHISIADLNPNNAPQILTKLKPKHARPFLLQVLLLFPTCRYKQ